MPNRSVGGYLVGLAALLLIQKLSHKKPRSYGANERPPQSKDEQPPRRRPLAVEIAEIRANPTEQEHREGEKEYWRKTSQYAFWAVVISAVALGAGIAAFIETRRQAVAAEEANRPWLYVERMDASKVEISKNSLIGANLDIYVNNVGHSVAHDVYIAARVVHKEDTNYFRAKDFCDSLEGGEFEYAGKVVFPGKMIALTGDAEPFKIDRNTNLRLIEVLTCVIYKTQQDNNIHKTGNVFLLKDFDTRVPSTTNDVSSLYDWFASGYAD